MSNAQQNRWPLQRLGDVTDNFDSVRVPVAARLRKAGPFPYYGATGIVDRINDYLFDGEYVLVAEDGENLRSRKEPLVFTAKGKFWVNNHAHVLQGNGRALTSYVAYALSCQDVHGFLTGSTFPKLTQDSLGRIMIPVPPPEAQSQITSVLGALDEKVQANSRMIATLRQSMQHAFDAVAQVPAVLGDIAYESRDKISPAKTPTAAFYLFSIPAFDDGRGPEDVIGSSVKSDKWLITEPAVLVSKLNPTTPRTWLANPVPARPAIASTEFVVLRPAGKVAIGLLYLACCTSAFKRALVERVTGTTGSHQRVAADDMLRIAIRIPNKESALPVHRLVGSGLELLNMLARESAILAQIRDLLLPRLISGEIHLADAGRP